MSMEKHNLHITSSYKLTKRKSALLIHCRFNSIYHVHNTWVHDVTYDV